MTSLRLDGCPYYLGTGTCAWPGVCGGSTTEAPEPKCRTEEPVGGWAAYYASDECTCWAPDDAEPEEHDSNCPFNPSSAVDAGYDEFDDDEEN